MDFDQEFHKVYQEMDKLVLIPVALVGLAALIIGANYAVTGEVVQKGIDFTAGAEITYVVEDDFSVPEIEQVFIDAGFSDPEVLEQETGGREGVIVRLPGVETEEDDAEQHMDSERARQIMEDAGYSVEVEGLNMVSPAVSEEFFQQAVMAFIMAFTIMSIVIFVAFRDVTPSFAVIFAAGGDILIAVAGMILLEIPLTLGSVAALLMLIGYSVDTDIVLSTRALKRQRGSLEGRIWSSTKTGVTMSAGGIAGFALLYIVSMAIVGPSELSNIAGVMVVGLLADIPLTWLGNAYILREYIESDTDLDFDLRSIR